MAGRFCQRTDARGLGSAPARQTIGAALMGRPRKPPGAPFSEMDGRWRVAHYGESDKLLAALRAGKGSKFAEEKDDGPRSSSLPLEARAAGTDRPAASSGERFADGEN